MVAKSNSFTRTGICPKFKLQCQNLQEGDEHTNQQRRNDHIKVMNAVEKQWDQLNTQLVKYGQNSEQISG
jgi:hypothetical protein